MIKYGCLAHFDHYYLDDIEFAKQNGFSFLQVWYDNKGIILRKEINPIESLKSNNFPFIIHAVLDICEFEEQISKLNQILGYLNQKELIIHPVCKNEKIDTNTNTKLSKLIKKTINEFKYDGINVYLENNSKLDPIFSSFEDIQEVIIDNPELELLFDIAHMESYEQIVKVNGLRNPKILHIADRNLSTIHEHLEIGKGNIDFVKIFNEILTGNEYRIILEIVESDTVIIKSKNIINEIIEKREGTSIINN